MSEITVVEILKALPGKKEALRKAVEELVPQSRESKGCLQYDLLNPIDEKEEILVLMRWENLEDLHCHEGSAYIAEFVKKYDNVLYSEVIQSEWKKDR